MTRNPAPVAPTAGGACRYCHCALQSTTATACVGCVATHTVRCPVCLTPTGSVLAHYKGRDEEGKPRVCPRCGNERVVLLEPKEGRP